MTKDELAAIKVGDRVMLGDKCENKTAEVERVTLRYIVVCLRCKQLDGCDGVRFNRETGKPPNHLQSVVGNISRVIETSLTEEQRDWLRTEYGMVV
jgi:hypothetical protein